MLLFDGVSRDTATALPLNNSPALDFSGKWNSVGLRHGRPKSADVLFADGHAEEVRQATRTYTTPQTSYETWGAEFVGESVTNDAAAPTVRNPEQRSVWDFWRE